MDCPACDVEIDLTHRVNAAPGVIARRGECPKCLVVFTTVEIAIPSTEIGGAHAVARKIGNGKIVASVKPAG